MTRDELDTMWQQALVASVAAGEKYTRFRFAELVAKAEREACKAIAEKELGNTAMLTGLPPQSAAAWNIVAAIRARGET
jgi:hypothetical protein